MSFFGKGRNTWNKPRPDFRCKSCGGWTGGSHGRLCQWCAAKKRNKRK